MPETRYEHQASAVGAESAGRPEDGRKPFISPTVEAMGGLAELTLIGGSL
jgi:hypothetical protein